MRLGSPTGRVNRFGQERGQLQLQRRLLRLVTFLVLILVMMRHASDPTNWNWFWALSSVEPSGSSEPTRDRASSSESETDRGHWIPGINRTLLGAVRDDSHFRKDEHEVWFHLWSCLKTTPSAELKAASFGNLSYLQLYRQMSIYRGQVCDLRGTIRRAHRLPAPSNELGIAEYWQCWLFPDESPTSPVVVYLLNAPASMAEGMELNYPVETTVCAFKRWAYSRGDTMLVAPVVMAAEVTALSAEPVLERNRRPNASPMPTWPWIVGAAVGAILLAWWLARASKHEPRSRERLPAITPAELAHLSDLKRASDSRRDESHESS